MASSSSTSMNAGDLSCYCKVLEYGDDGCNSDPREKRPGCNNDIGPQLTFDENFQYTHSTCFFCNGYFGPCFGEPVCATCHAFIFPDSLLHSEHRLVLSEKTDDGDSGNDEPSEMLPDLRMIGADRPSPGVPYVEGRVPHAELLMPLVEEVNQPRADIQIPEGWLQLEAAAMPPVPTVPPSLSKQLEMLSLLCVEGDAVSPGLVEQLPPEVLLTLFSYLDDLSLWSCSHVCKRWHQLLVSHVPDAYWERYTARRWPLFRPFYTVDNWFRVYGQLITSCHCYSCLLQMSAKSQPPGEESSWRTHRVRIESKTLRTDPPEGIEAIPLDQKCFHWQATITGPADSPYAGGLFYLYLQVPYSYPMCPPVVRFLTRIFHPNVSRHGDVGIDSIHHNWSLALTISKVLISIQSLLTDPFCQVCMEPDIGALYQEDKETFENIARTWTWRYAMHDTMEPYGGSIWH